MTTHAEQRTVFVPDGLAGERVDAAMARMFGFSRTRAADLITDGLVQVDGAVVGKSDRVHAGSMLDVTIPAETDPLAVVPEIVEGIRIIHDDDAIVVIDKPVGVAVHPRRDGPDRPWSATSPEPASGSPPVAPANARGSSNASTSARAA